MNYYLLINQNYVFFSSKPMLCRSNLVFKVASTYMYRGVSVFGGTNTDMYLDK